MKIVTASCVLNNICNNEHDFISADETDFNQPHVEHCNTAFATEPQLAMPTRQQQVFAAMYNNDV